MNRVISLLQRKSKGKTVLALFALTSVVYAVILGYSIPLVLSFSPDLILFDMSPMGYRYDEAVNLLTALGQDGRHAYLTVQIPIDLIYPGLFGVSYALMLTWILKQGFAKHSKIFWLAYVPILAGLFDYLENASIVAMLWRFPDVSEGLVKTASLFTVAKSGFTTVFFMVLLAGLLFLGVRKVRGVAKKAAS